MLMTAKSKMFRHGRLLVAVFVLLAFSATAANAAVRTVGATKGFELPDITNVNDCRVFTRATAFQLKSSAQPEYKKLSRVPVDGTMIAWSVALPKITSVCITGFDNGYYGAASARISVLRRAPRKGKPYHRYKLVAQSPSVQLRSYFGINPSYALNTPLPVKRNDIIAVTTETWFPAFSFRPEDAGSTYRASRPANKCDMNKSDNYINAKTARMHMKVDQIRTYGCGYTGARLLYNATIVDTPVKTKGYK
jgi:hypothetical protein